jgi:hypothetical protein
MTKKYEELPPEPVILKISVLEEQAEDIFSQLNVTDDAGEVNPMVYAQYGSPDP